MIDLQILKITLPESYEDSIVQTQVENQTVNLKQFEQKAELVRQNSQVILSEADQKISVINAEAYAEGYKSKQESIVFK